MYFFPNTSIYLNVMQESCTFWSSFWSLYPWQLASIVSSEGGDGYHVLSGHSALCHRSASAWKLVLGIDVTCVSIQKTAKAMARPDKMCPFAPLKTQHPAEPADHLWHQHGLQSLILFWHVIQENIIGYKHKQRKSSMWKYIYNESRIGFLGHSKLMTKSKMISATFSFILHE